MPDLGGRVGVVVAVGDQNFLRLAAAVLVRAGHRVWTTTDRPTRVARMVRLHVPDVLILEADSEAGADIEARIGRLPLRPALLYVADDPAASPGAQTRAPKWERPEELVHEVERLAAGVSRTIPEWEEPGARGA
jgi:hypothetical protein